MNGISKKTILFMAQLPPPVHGAALRNKSLLDSELINTGFTLYPLPLKFIDDMRDLGKFSFGKILLMIQYAYRMTWILITKRIDLAYFTMSPSGGAFYRDILFITILKIFRKKILLHFRVKGIKKTAESATGRWLVKYAFKGTDIVCLSQNHLQDLEGFVSRKPYIVPNGIKVETEFLPLSEQYSSDEQAAPNILFLSNLSRKKGIPELIEALRIIKNRNYHFSADLVGGEWDMSYTDVKYLIQQAGLQGHVHLTGPKYGKDKFSYIAKTDIFVFPTYFELFPGVILEAMQFGKAIVSTFEGSIPEMIDNGINGILVPQKEPIPLAEAIVTLIDNPEKRNKMARHAKNKFFSEFTLPVFEDNMFSVFTTVLQKQ